MFRMKMLLALMIVARLSLLTNHNLVLYCTNTLIVLESTYLLTLLYYTTRVHVNVHVLESSCLNGVQHVFIQQ